MCAQPLITHFITPMLYEFSYLGRGRFRLSLSRYCIRNHTHIFVSSRLDRYEQLTSPCRQLCLYLLQFSMRSFTEATDDNGNFILRTTERSRPPLSRPTCNPNNSTASDYITIGDIIRVSFRLDPHSND